MIVTVVYYEESSKAPKMRTFSDIDLAKEWLKEDNNSSYINRQNARVMVDYSAIEAYKELYDLMKKQLFVAKQDKDKVLI